jgi:hypothetical protein
MANEGLGAGKLVPLLRVDPGERLDDLEAFQFAADSTGRLPRDTMLATAEEEP